MLCIYLSRIVAELMLCWVPSSYFHSIEINVGSISGSDDPVERHQTIEKCQDMYVFLV